MSYNKQNFVNGQPLTAQQLNYMENGLVQLNAELDNVNTEITNIEDNYATKDFVRSEINNAEIGGDGELDVDLSIYALKTEIPKYIQTGALPDSTIGFNATAEGALNIASGDYSHAEGVNNKAIGRHSHAEGANTQATEIGAHAEGTNSNAAGDYSHAEGNHTVASGKYSHAEGYGAKASGVYSHAEGVGTIAAGDYQHVQGMFNKEDTTSQYAFIVGNGYSLDDSLENAERSNAYTLDWDGNAWFAGAINCEDKTTTLANLGAAPAGYGLGGEAERKDWSEVDSITANGTYRFNGIHQTINGIYVTSAVMRCINFGDGYCTQILRTVENASGHYKSYTLVRSKGAIGWDAWECPDPPMVLWTEYRTTKRWKDLPVYTKAIPMGSFPVNSYKTSSFGANATSIMNLHGELYYNGEWIPFPVHLNGELAAYCWTDGSSVGVTTLGDISSGNANFVIEYTKN